MEAEDKNLADALDGLWGVCESLCSIAAMSPDTKDGRLQQASEALEKAQDAIQKIQEELD